MSAEFALTIKFEDTKETLTAADLRKENNLRPFLRYLQIEYSNFMYILQVPFCIFSTL